MTEPASSSSSLLSNSVSKQSLSPSSAPDWSLLPEELLHIISKKLDDCFDAVHARSVCTLWRSIFPFPSYLSRLSYSLPTLEDTGSWSLEKIPLFLFRNRALASEYFLGGIRRYEEPEEELPSPIQCSVKVENSEIPGSEPRLMNMLNCQIFPLGHQYRMIGCNAEGYRNVAILPLNQEGGEGGEGDFVVLLNLTKVLLVFRSTEMRWRRLHTQPFTTATCEELFTFRGKFYAIFISGDVFAFDPHFQGLTTLKPLELPNCGSCNDLVQSGDDELFLVEKIIPRNDDVLDFNHLALRVCRLDVEAGQWVVVSDIGDRVFVIGEFGSVSCMAKEFPDGCGVSGNSILYTHKPWNETYFYKYGVDTGREEDDRNCWWYSREILVTIVSTSPVVALRVEREAMDRT